MAPLAVQPRSGKSGGERVIGKDAPDPPTPIDPFKTAAAQTQSNEATARLEQKLGMTGTVGPGGTVRYVANPNSPSGYDQITEFSPEQRDIYDLGAQAQAGALRVAGNQLGRIDTALGRTLDAPHMAESFEGGRPLSYSFDNGGQMRRSFDAGQGVTYDVGPQNFEQARDETIDAEFGRARSRLDPMWDQASNKEEIRLANQGLGANSTAYQNAKDTFGRAKNDAYSLALSDAVREGNNEAGRMFDQSMQQGEFRNRAAGQDYAQNMGAAGFENDATLSDFERNMAAAGFGNATSGQEFGQNMGRADFGNRARQLNFQNAAFSRSQPISDFAALMGTGGGPAMPVAYSGPTPGVAPTDVIGAHALRAQQDMNAYNARVANINSRNQAFGNLAGAVVGLDPFGWGKG